MLPDICQRKGQTEGAVSVISCFLHIPIIFNSGVFFRTVFWVLLMEGKYLVDTGSEVVSSSMGGI